MISIFTEYLCVYMYHVCAYRKEIGFLKTCVLYDASKGTQHAHPGAYCADTSLSLELPKSDDSLAGDMGNRLLQSVFPSFMVRYT